MLTGVADLLMPKRIATAKPNFRLQIKHGIAIGPGKAALLEAISVTGSISEAARTMEMSYRTAWQLVSSMNEHFISPLVSMTKGGKSGGGAELTTLGWDVLHTYKRMEEKAVQAIEADIAHLESMLKTL